MKDEGHLIMSQIERVLKVLLESVKAGYLTLKEASERVGLSYRQMKRRKHRYLKEGDTGLMHRRRGQASSRAFPKDFKQSVLALYRERYLDFGPTFASEKLLEDGSKLHHDTLRKWLLAEGLWSPHRKPSVPM
ncbi:MAG: helix-turn-helix domain-containing protein [Gammaproteobacteria bacterium]|nr:helix-turn-helix domain-containing protein [Gammaproteobacteria bacterium]